jgi:PX domain
VKRRYRDFAKLFQCLSKCYPTHVIPRLPEKSLLSGFFRFKPEFIETRRQKLQEFLAGLAMHPILGTHLSNEIYPAKLMRIPP